MKKLLLQLDSDRFASSFDTIAAYDAGVDRVIPFGGVRIEDVRNIVYGAMFTRGGDDLKNSAIFIGGSSVPTGEAMLKTASESFFGPLRVSVMADPNGSNTTAAAAVLKIVRAISIEGKQVVILAGTGPVGLRAARLFAHDGAQVRVTNLPRELCADRWDEARARHDLELAQAQAQVSGFEVYPVDLRADLVRAFEEADVALATGPIGVQLISDSVWKSNLSLKIVADINAVPPAGIGGIEPMDDAKLREGKLAFGAIGIGGLKMNIHRAAVAKLFEKNNLILDVEEIYEIAKTL